MIRISQIVMRAFPIWTTFAPQVAQAQMGYEAASLEWLVADSDVVVRASIDNVERAAIPNPDPETFRNLDVRKTITLHVHETLKGDPIDRLMFSEEMLETDHIYEGWRDAKTELLWFFKREGAADAGDPNALKPYGLGWSVIRLGAEVPEEDGWSPRPPPIFNMNLEALTDPEAILEAARRAVDARSETGELHAHQVILPRAIMERSGRSGDANRLTVPADKRLEDLAHRLIHETAAFLREGEEGLSILLRLEGVRALRSFPSDDNRRLLRVLPNALTTLPERDQAMVEEIRRAGEDIVRAWALEVQILPYPGQNSLFHRNPVIVRFTNRDTQSIRILRPLDGSEWSWHMPYYRFTVRDAEGNELGLSPRCGMSGLWANRNWADDYIILLGPGDSYEMQVGLPQAISADGEYFVSFAYVFDQEVAANSNIQYPEGLWVGESRSHATKLQLRKPD